MAETTDRIEAVARAICDTWGYIWDGDPEDDQTAPEVTEGYDDRPSKTLFREAAKAALAAYAPQPSDREACGAEKRSLDDLAWLDGNQVWEGLFSICKGDVPEGMTEAVCDELAGWLRDAILTDNVGEGQQ